MGAGMGQFQRVWEISSGFLGANGWGCTVPEQKQMRQIRQYKGVSLPCLIVLLYEHMDKNILDTGTRIASGAVMAAVLAAEISHGIPDKYITEVPQHIPVEQPISNVQITVYAANTSTSASVFGV